jgi:hypothetical protein
MIIWAGTDGANLNTGASFSPALNMWTALNTTAAPPANQSYWAVWDGTHLTVLGSNDSNDADKITGGRYDPATGTWSAFGLAPPASTSRANGTLVWTGNQMLYSGGTYFNSGVRSYSADLLGYTPPHTSYLYLKQ